MAEGILFVLQLQQPIHWYVNQPFADPADLNPVKIRTHPVTGLKILAYNPTFIDRIQELNGQESSHILAFLREHLLNADDLGVRWKWTPGAVAFWDNRSVVHKALPGGYDVTLREGKRTAIFGERPFFDPDKSESLSQRTERLNAGKKDTATHVSSEPELNN